MRPGLRILVLTCLLMMVLPSVAEAAGGARRSVFAQIRPGDSLGKIAARYGVKIEDLKKWNPEKTRDENYIRVGDALLVMVSAE